MDERDDQRQRQHGFNGSPLHWTLVGTSVVVFVLADDKPLVRGIAVVAALGLVLAPAAQGVMKAFSHR